MVNQVIPHRAVGSTMNMLSSMEDDMITMLADIPTHLEKNNAQRVKKMAKTQRAKIISNAASIKAKRCMASARCKNASSVSKEN